MQNGEAGRRQLCRLKIARLQKQQHASRAIGRKSQGGRGGPGCLLCEASTGHTQAPSQGLDRNPTPAALRGWARPRYPLIREGRAAPGDTGTVCLCHEPPRRQVAAASRAGVLGPDLVPVRSWSSSADRPSPRFASQGRRGSAVPTSLWQRENKEAPFLQQGLQPRRHFTASLRLSRLHHCSAGNG